jgi:hypothetical protein
MSTAWGKWTLMYSVDAGVVLFTIVYSGWGVFVRP